MKIDNNYSIENDSHQWILKYEREGDINQKTGNPTKSESKWYCGTLKQALQRYLDECLKPAKDAQTIIQLIVLSEQKITEYLNQINHEN